MAVIHTAYRVSQTANADSLTIALRDGIVANDIIYAIVSVRRVNAALAGTGYNAIINSSAGTTWATYHMNKIAAGGESSISITNTGAILAAATLSTAVDAWHGEATWREFLFVVASALLILSDQRKNINYCFRRNCPGKE